MAGLQLLGLSLQCHTDPTAVLDELHGSQHYILDYLTEEVLRQQPEPVQKFLLYTSISERLNASLCDAIMERSGSQQILEELERANLFVVSLDEYRHWYRYHGLFAEALRYRLEGSQAALVPTLHLRASAWYEQQEDYDEAVRHALQARDFERAARLIERVAFMLSYRGSDPVPLLPWLRQLPPAFVRHRPYLCLIYAQMLFLVAPPTEEAVQHTCQGVPCLPGMGRNWHMVHAFCPFDKTREPCATQLAYRDALNFVSRYAFEHGKMSSGRALQRDTYDEIRLRYKIPAQMACNVPRQVGATYKVLWTKVKQNAALRKAGKTRKRYKGLDTPPKYVSPTLTYNYQRDYSLKPDKQVSILTLQGRVILPYTGYSKHIALIQHDAHMGAARLWYDKPHKQFYLLVSLEVEGTEPTPETHKAVIGVDVGQRYLAVTATTRDETTFYSGKQVRAKADHYARLRKRLQKKGTRSATRRLVVISGRERRLKQAVNHMISHRIVDQHPHSLIGLENLTAIRERTKRKHGKQASKKQRRANQHASQWAFAELGHL
jgi:putative transposase